MRTRHETSLVLPVDDAPAGARIEGPWRMLAVAGPLPFDAVGILARISAPLAASAIPIFVVSTFDTDYVLLPEARAEAGKQALRAAGLAVSGASW